MDKNRDIKIHLCEIDSKLAKLDNVETLLVEVKTALQFQNDLLEKLTNHVSVLEKENSIIRTKIVQLEKTNVEQTTKIEILETKLDAVEQQSRVDNLIVSGLSLQSYSSHFKDNENGEHKDYELEGAEAKLMHLFHKEMRVDIKPNDISTLHFITTGNKKKQILVKFTSRKSKNQVMRARKNFKNRATPVYINEHLTERTSTIAYHARQLKKQNIIANTWTKDCRVFVKLNGETPEQQKVLAIRSV